MPRGSGCRLIPLLSPEAEAPLPPGSSGLSQHPVGLTLSPARCSHGQSTSASSCSGKPCPRSPCPSWLPHRVQSTVGAAVGVIRTPALSYSGRLLLRSRSLAEQWHRTGHKSTPVVLSGGFGGKMPSCPPAQCGTAAAALVVIVQHPCTGHRSQTELGWARSRPCSASALAPRGELAQRDLGVCQGRKEPSFSSHQTTPTPHRWP